jgi:hypothetical protein
MAVLLLLTLLLLLLLLLLPLQLALPQLLLLLLLLLLQLFVQGQVFLLARCTHCATLLEVLLGTEGRAQALHTV